MVCTLNETPRETKGPASGLRSKAPSGRFSTISLALPILYHNVWQNASPFRKKNVIFDPQKLRLCHFCCLIINSFWLYNAVFLLFYSRSLRQKFFCNFSGRGRFFITDVTFYQWGMGRDALKYKKSRRLTRRGPCVIIPDEGGFLLQQAVSPRSNVLEKDRSCFRRGLFL